MKQLFNNTEVSEFPKVRSGKEVLRVSPSVVMRRREPTNPHTASKLPNMVWDYTNQQKVWPDGKPNSLIEATQTTHSNDNYKTMNRSGHPYALGVFVGGSPDTPGKAYARPPRTKVFK
jgi:hypothetical protein